MVIQNQKLYILEEETEKFKMMYEGNMKLITSFYPTGGGGLRYRI